jgi:hypothetical protein
MFAGWMFFMIRLEIHNEMQRVVARLAPPKTNRPLKNLAEALNWKRVHKEYERLFPTRAKWKFLWMKIR